jgi:hypothetical protein
LDSFRGERDSWRMFHDVAFQGQLDLNIEKDWDWLQGAVEDEQRPIDERHLALETALWLNRMSTLSDKQERIAKLRELCGAEEKLLAEIAQEFREPDPRWGELQAEREKNQREREVQEAADRDQC